MARYQLQIIAYSSEAYGSYGARQCAGRDQSIDLIGESYVVHFPEHNASRVVQILSADNLILSPTLATSPPRLLGVSLEEPVLLLVEDDALVVMVAEDALKRGGYAVSVATSGVEAVSALNTPSANFAAVITDIGLGVGPDGWEVARHAREHQADMPIVYMTAESAGEWPIHGVPNSLLVQKPYAPAQLLAAISTVIAAADTGRTTSELSCDHPRAAS